MNPAEKDFTEHIPKPIRKPFILVVVSVAVLVFSVSVSIFFLTAILGNSWLVRVMLDYFPNLDIDRRTLLIITISGFILYSISAIGIFLMLRLRRIGFFLYLVATLVVVMVPYLSGYGNLLSSLVFLATIAVFSFFYRKMR